MMSAADLVSWGFSHVLVGAVTWALLFSGGIMDKAREHSRATFALISVGTVFGWPVLLVVFVGGMLQAARRRGVRS